MKTKKHEINFTSGNLPKKIIRFSIPIILSGLFQISYNVADMIVVGKFVGDNSLAAIGTTSSLIILIINLFMGHSQGTTIMVSKYYGAKNYNKMLSVAHTSILISFIGGIILSLFGYFCSGYLIKLMGLRDNVFDMAHTYVRLYFLGMPVMMLYNFSSGIMRAYGDTKRPLYFLTISGILNIIMNIIFVVPLGMGIEGVAYATIISQTIAAILNLICLSQESSVCRISLKKLRIDKIEFLNIIRHGLPAGIQNTLFSFSNVLMQTAINSFGTTVMAAHGAATYVGNVLGTVSSGFGAASTTCTSQNLGAKNKQNIFKGFIICIIYIVLIELFLGILSVILAPQIMSMFTNNADTIAAGMFRMKTEMAFYFISGFATVAVCGLRGRGYSFTPMLISIFGSCVLRIVWLYTIFRLYPTILCLYIAFPITWAITSIAHIIMFIKYYKRLDF